MTRIFTIANLKGGAGKTTTAVNLAAGLAHTRPGTRTLLIDADPQANATLHLGVTPDDLAGSLATFLERKHEVNEVVLRDVRAGLDLLPATIDLDPLEYLLVTDPAAHNRFRYRVIPPDTYDFVVVDTRPSIGFLTTNALLLAEVVIIPLQAEYFGAHSFLRTLDRLEHVTEATFERAQARLLLTQYDKRTSLHSTTADHLAEHLQSVSTMALDLQRCETVIRTNTDLARATASGQDIFRYSPRSRGAQDYRQLAEEITR